MTNYIYAMRWLVVLWVALVGCTHYTSADYTYFDTIHATYTGKSKGEWEGKKWKTEHRITLFKGGNFEADAATYTDGNLRLDHYTGAWQTVGHETVLVIDSLPQDAVDTNRTVRFTHSGNKLLKANGRYLLSAYKQKKVPKR